MIVQEFHKFLDNEINLSQFEEWIYKNTELENIISKDDYQFFLEFNYNKKSAEVDIQNFIFKNLLSEKEFSHWKVNKLLESIKVEFPTNNLFSYAKQNPHFLGGKELRFKNYWNKRKVEIFWASKISTFNEKSLYLGTYENSYVHLIVNRNDEIWLAYDIVNKQDFWAENLKEAIAKLFIRKY